MAHSWDRRVLADAGVSPAWTIVGLRSYCGRDARALGRQPRRLHPAPGTARLLIAADRDDAGRRAAATLEARALAQGIAATVLTPEHGDFNDDLAALGPPALAARLGHDMM